MDEMDQMIAEIDTSVSHDLVKIAATVTVFAVAYAAGRALFTKREKNTVVSYEEFLANKDEYARFYINPSVN